MQIRYGERAVCGPFSLELRQGSRIALDGRNGSGKSSLLKLICREAGVLPVSSEDLPLSAADLPGGNADSGNPSNAISYTGEVLPGAGLKISYLPQDASFLTGSPADYAEKCGIEERLFFTVLRKLGFERVQFEKNMEDYSGGQKKKVLLARSLCEPAHLYIWDEPLNYIDIDSRMQLENLILEYEPTMIFVEHDRMFRERIATEVREI